MDSLADSRPIVYVIEHDGAVRDRVAERFARSNFTVQYFGSAEAFLDGYRPERPGCLVLDVQLPGMSGLALQELLPERQIDVPVIFATAYADVAGATRALRSGAHDFFEKPLHPDAVFASVTAAVEKDIANRKRTAWRAEMAGRFGSLSAREREVLDLVLLGRLNKQIGETLEIAQRTVEDHRRHIMEKMRVSSVAELARLVITYEVDT